MRIIYFGTYRKDYVRNRMLIDGLRFHGVEVIECQQDIWRSTDERIQAVIAGWHEPRFWFHLISVYTKLITEFLKISDFDTVVVGYPGHLDVLIARLLTWLKKKPLAWDILMSLVLISTDRNLQTYSRLGIGLLKILETISLRLPDMLFIDTLAYRDWFVSNYQVNINKFRIIPIGADDRYFQKDDSRRITKNMSLTVIYYGTYIPNHGTKIIIETIKLLANDTDIKFFMVGEGPDRQYCFDEAKKFNLNNVEFIDWLEKDELIPLINRSDIVLGSFGIVSQSFLTIHNKVYEGMAMMKAVITGDSPAIREVFTDKKELLLCKRGDPQCLAEAIVLLKKDSGLKNLIAHNGHEYYITHSTLELMGARMKKFLDELLLSKQRIKQLPVN